MEKGHASPCPNCGTAYGPFDGNEVVRTRTGRMLERWIFPVTRAWCLVILVAAAIFSGIPSRGGTLERGIGWLLIGLPAIPGFVLWMASWFFPKVRRFHCRNCGVVTEVPFNDGAAPVSLGGE